MAFLSRMRQLEKGKGLAIYAPACTASVCHHASHTTGKGWSDDSHSDNTGLAPGTGDHPHIARTTIIIDLGHSVLGRSPEDAQDFH